VLRNVRLLLDECCAHRTLVKELKARNFNVERSIDLSGMGATDQAVFESAINDSRILVTANCDDFIELAKEHEGHPAMLLIYPDEDGTAMSISDIVKAIANVWQSFGEDSAALQGQRIPLPHYVW
jgi:predicted nuclease of predicted toxin-antitoxin system